MSLRDAVKKLALTNPELRPHLLPLLKKASWPEESTIYGAINKLHRLGRQEGRSIEDMTAGDMAAKEWMDLSIFAKKMASMAGTGREPPKSWMQRFTRLVARAAYAQGVLDA